MRAAFDQWFQRWFSSAKPSCTVLRIKSMLHTASQDQINIVCFKNVLWPPCRRLRMHQRLLQPIKSASWKLERAQTFWHKCQRRLGSPWKKWWGQKKIGPTTLQLSSFFVMDFYVLICINVSCDNSYYVIISELFLRDFVSICFLAGSSASPSSFCTTG